MSAVKIVCSISDALKNTGSNSDLLPGAPAMLIALDKSKRFSLDDLASDPLGYFTEQAHNVGKDKIFPMFGFGAPIDFLSNADTQDTTQTTDSGKTRFVRYGYNVMNIGTLSGGLCLARALLSFNNANLGWLMIDSQGMGTIGDYKSGIPEKYGGIPGYAFAPKMSFADFTNAARINFQLSFNPSEFLQKAKIVSGLEGCLDLIGLHDLDLSVEDTPNSTGVKLLVKLIDDCCGDDMVVELGANLLNPTNFIVTRKDTGAVIPVTSVDTLSTDDTVLQLHGSFAQGITYIVSGNVSSQLYANDIEGFDITGSVEVTVPA